MYGRVARQQLLVHEYHAEIIEQKGLIQLGHNLLGTLRINAYHHTVRAHEVIDGIALLKELGVAGHVKLNGDAPLVKLRLYGMAHFPRRPNGHGALGHHHHVFVHVLSDGLCHLQDIV